MNGTLKDKMLEFRNISQIPFLQEILDSEQRLDFERTVKERNAQLYRNEQQREGTGKWNAIRLHEQRRHECNLLSKLKSDRAAQLVAKEKRENEEALAKELKKVDEEKEIYIKKRLHLRNTEPELRDLAVKIRQRLGGQILASQIQFNSAQKKAEIEKNLEFEKQLVEADRIAEERYIKDAYLREMKDKEEMRRMLTEQKDTRNSKIAAIKAEKEDNKRLIDELVEEENRKIAEENAEKQKFREQSVEEYKKFIERQAEKIEDKEKIKEWERCLLEEQKRAFERREQAEQKKRESVESRIQLQEAVLDLTSKLREAKERERYGFLEVNEAIAEAKDELKGYEMDNDEWLKAEKNMKKFREELQQIIAYRRKMKEEERAEERKQDRMLMEAVLKEAADREAEKQLKKTKWMEEMNAQLEHHKMCRQQESEREKHEEQEALRRQREHESRVAAERRAMWAEFEEYLQPSADCK